MIVRKLSFLLAVLTASFIVTSLSSTSDAQTANLQSPARGQSVGNAFSMGDFESINMSNGNLTFNFPLGSLPGGRGQSGQNFSLTYNSKLWDLGNEKVLSQANSAGPTDYVSRTVIKKSPNGGWRVTGGYSIELEDRQAQMGAPSQGIPLPECRAAGIPTPVWEEMTYRWKLKVIFPDGSAHEMIPHGHQDIKNDGYFRVLMDGRQEDCGNGLINPPTPNHRPTYYSTDGTFLRLETTANGWTLYFPDGGKVVDGHTVHDRNGNWYSTSVWGDLTDQFDRTITYTSNGPNETLVTSKGVGGQDIVWTILWKNIYVTKTFQACAPHPVSCPAVQAEGALKGEQFLVVDKIIQPSQMGSGQYVFSYNAPSTSSYPNLSDGWGEISGVTLPSGAFIEYDYAMDGQNGLDVFGENKKIIDNYPTKKRLSYKQKYDGVEDTNLTTEEWNYTSSDSLAAGITTPDGGLTQIFSGKIYYQDPSHWKANLTLKTIAPDGTKTENLWERNFPVACTWTHSCGDPHSSNLHPVNSYTKATFTSVKDSTNAYKTAIKEFNYDKNGNVTEVREYDWAPESIIPRDQHGLVSGMPSCISADGNAPCNVPKRITKTEYYNAVPAASSTSYTHPDSYHLKPGQRFLGLPRSVEIQDGTGTPKSRSEMSYDHTTYGGNSIGGNLVSTKAWDSTKGNLDSEANGSKLWSANFISTSATYDPNYGVPLTTTDAKGNVTQIIYDPMSTPTGTWQYIYPTKTVVAHGTSVARTSSAAYDFYSGLVTSSTDVDNNLTNATVYDRFGRPTKVISALGTPLEAWTQTTYNDTQRFIVVRSDLEVKGDGKKVASQFFDPIGRVRLTTALEDAATQDPTNELHGIKVQTRYQAAGACTFGTGNTCTFGLTSNPYRAATSSAASSEETFGWTRSQTQNNGKHSEVETFSGGSLPAPWGGNNATTGVVKTDKDADRTLVTDQADKKRISRTNALGQLSDVWEITGQGLGAEPVNFPGAINVAFGYKTSYNYEVLGGLASTTQGSQTRSYTYSSLSRLLLTTNPESGTINYNYDQNGNLVQRIDARNVTVSYTYDALNRNTQRSYAGETGGYLTPMVTYEYGTEAPAVGKLKTVSSTVSANHYSSFDILGRPLLSQQVIDGRSFDTSYTYNLSGALVEQTYPSTRKVKNVLDNNGHVALVESRKDSNSGYWQYAGNFSYAPSGAMTSMQLGNGRWESTRYNSRHQPIKIALGSTQQLSDNLLKIDYSYGTTQNNGNVLGQQITVPTVNGNPGFVATQAYQYDPLSRLTQALETTPNQSGWQQTFIYDRYGNRRFDTTQNRTTTLPSNCHEAVCNPAAHPTNNKLLGTTYDNAGNTVVDGSSQKYVYDGENKMVAAKDAAGNLIGQYWYNGDGKRVKKYVPNTGEVTIFIYDASGKTIEEYSTKLSDTPQVAYLTSDQLGSARINTNAYGAVIARYDYHPFGEEIIGNGRNQGHGYGSDEIRKKFTGYERDNETELDFAQARYYAKNLGRFQSADPYNIIFREAKASRNNNDQAALKNYISNPQVWNKYGYSLNSPHNLVDKTGNCSAPSGLKPGQTGICVEAFIASRSIGGIGYGDNRRHSGQNPELTARYTASIIVTPNSSNETPNSGTASTSHISWTARTERSYALIPGIPIPVGLKGTSTTEVTNAVSESDDTTRFRLSVSAVNGWTGYGGPAGDIAFDVNFVVTPEGSVGVEEGSASRTFPSFAIYSYTMDENGNVTTQEIITTDEQNSSDLTKPKKRLPTVAPR